MTKPIRHGAYSSYRNRGCRCEPCTHAYRQWFLDYHRDHTLGHRRRTDAAPARAHIEALLNTGMSCEAISRAAGVSHDTARRILNGKQRLNVTIANKLLAVQPAAVDTTLVPAIGTQRRLQALAAMGHPFTTLDEALGLGPRTISHALYQPYVTLARAREVQELYDRLSMTPGPSHRARVRATNRGWAPPLAWDDDTIDDPTAQPQGIRTPTTALNQRTVHLEDIEYLVNTGITWPLLLERLGCGRSVVQKRVKDAGRYDLLQQLQRNEGRELAA